jgi:DNA invertase Pin-like site-specific DNA recombinase
MKEYIAYYRVSTDKQGTSGLGLDAQREAVKQFLGERGQPLTEYTEVESGRRHTNRPQLLAALDECRKRRASLVIAKLDRLARDVHFISGLMKSEIEFVAVDMPTANKFTIHILAAVAEHEREIISKRTKDALAAAKARGQKLGNPRAAEMIAAARAAKPNPPPAPEVVTIMREKQAQGKGLREIARELNRLAIRTPLGKEWYATTVKNTLANNDLCAKLHP